MPEFLQIRNWDRFQHYKKRNPPWIKLHFELFSSADWVVLDDASKLLAVACMLIASRHDGSIPEDTNYIKRIAYLNKTPNLKPLIDCGFLIKMQADASESKRVHTNARPETETETETETEKKDISFETWWDLWSINGTKRAKERARPAFKRALKTASFDALCDGLTAYMDWCRANGTDVIYIKHPTTWLNGGCWKDELPEKGNGKIRDSVIQDRTDRILDAIFKA